MAKCTLNTDLKVLEEIKKQLKNDVLFADDLKILDDIAKFLEVYGWEKFKREKAHSVVYNQKKNEGSFYLTRRKNGDVVRGIFKISKVKEDIVLELKLIEIDPNYYKT